MRQASIRNQRNKGFRVKHFLQLCLLAAICIWLLYQLKHSYDKKRAIEERNTNILDRVTERQSDFFKLGRKDLPHGEDKGSANKKEDENEVEEDEEQETKLETENEEVEEEEKQDTKQETENEEGSGVGDDEINKTHEQDQEWAVEEAEHGEESADQEDKDAQVDGTDLFDDKEDEGGSQEAREEHYKKDDASSAVRHDTQLLETEFRNEGARSLDEQMENEKYVERENVDKDTVDGLKGNSDTDTSVGAVDSSNGNGNLSMNGTSVENREPEVGVSNLEVQSVSNSTSVEYGTQRELQTNLTASAESNNQMELQTNTMAVLTNQMETQNNSTEVDAVTSIVPLQNETVQLDSVQDRNATVDTRTTEEDKPNMAAVGIKLTEKSNTSENGDAAQGESDDPSQTEKSNTSNDRDAAQIESNDPSQTEKSNASENGDAAQGEFDDSSHNTVTDEEREARTDLSTLPNLEIGAKNDEDEAAE